MTIGDVVTVDFDHGEGRKEKFGPRQQPGHYHGPAVVQAMEELFGIEDEALVRVRPEGWAADVFVVESEIQA